MRTKKKSIQRSLIFGSLACMLVLCLCLSVSAYFLFSSALYARHRDTLAHVLTHVENQTDADDLRECLKTGVPSEKYAQLQKFLNGFVDDAELSYLYIVIPRPEEGVMVNAISATSAAEFAAGETDLPILYETDAYSRETLERFREHWDDPETAFFQEFSKYGTFYTACRPLRASDGETVALICADIPLDTLYDTINHYVLISVASTLLIGLLFAFFLIRWLKRNVTGPVLQLEKSAKSFAARSHSLRDLRQLEFEMPDIRTNNEVQSLSEAIYKMSHDLKTGVERMLSAEARAVSAEIEAEDMTRIAYQDALTHVKSKAAFDNKSEELTRQIETGKAVFALVMVDMNELKEINDAYGHDCGDKYLIGACMLVCEVYKHSPVYRVGGDEFVVLLQGADYENREALLNELRERMRQTVSDPGREPWERFSAAAGMAEYPGEDGETVEQVLAKADERMYQEKERMKAAPAN